MYLLFAFGCNLFIFFSIYECMSISPISLIVFYFFRLLIEMFKMRVFFCSVADNETVVVVVFQLLMWCLSMWREKQRERETEKLRPWTITRTMIVYILHTNDEIYVWSSYYEQMTFTVTVNNRPFSATACFFFLFAYTIWFALCILI